MADQNHQPGRMYGFGIRGLKNHPELIPLVCVVSFAIGVGMSFMTYSLRKKPDVQIVRGHGHKTVWENVRPTEKRKLVVVNPTMYKPIPEVESMKREIGSYKSPIGEVEKMERVKRDIGTYKPKKPEVVDPDLDQESD